MGDILSQNEIDELLNALNTGEIDVDQMDGSKEEKKIKVHDFRKPNKFAKDHLRTLQIIHENFGRLLSNFLSGYLRTMVHVDVISVEELTYSEFNNSLSNPLILAILSIDPLPGSAIIEVVPNIAFAIIERVLGGKGTGSQKVRGFSEIELSIIERIITQMIQYLKEPWENVVNINPKLEKIETNAQFAQIISPNEMTALVTLGIKIDQIEGMINICLPYIVLEPIIPKLSTKFWFSTGEKVFSKESIDILEHRVESTQIPVSAVLGTAVLSFADVIEMQSGDVIQLDTCIDEKIKVYVGDMYKFKAKPGVKKSKVAIKITDIIREEA